MPITKEEIAMKAKELGLTLTEEQIDGYIKLGKLPEKEETISGTRVEELVKQYSARQLAEMLLETRGEAGDRRRENKDLKAQAEALTKEIQGLTEIKNKYPDLETKFKTIESQLQAARESEKKRREAAIQKLDEKKRATFSYLLEVEKIAAEQFDATIEALAETKSPGSGSPSPAGTPPKVELSPQEKQEADRMGLTPEAYREIQEKRKTRGPLVNQPQVTLSPIIK